MKGHQVFQVFQVFQTFNVMTQTVLAKISHPLAVARHAPLDKFTEVAQ